MWHIFQIVKDLRLTIYIYQKIEVLGNFCGIFTLKPHFLTVLSLLPMLRLYSEKYIITGKLIDEINVSCSKI